MFSLLQANLWQQLEQWDQWAFIKLNSGLANPVLDAMIPFVRHDIYWAPLYLFLATFVLFNFKSGGWWLLFFACTIAITDMTGTLLFNSIINRFRPCQDPDFSLNVRLVLKQCPRGYSFISNPAANYFSLAAFFFATFRSAIKKWAWIGFVWAGFIAFTQVYMGINYPFDVLAGILFGLTAGLLTGKLFNKRHGFIIFDNQPVA
jgi:membrane-associated phospholipid phosphatase